MHSNLVYRDQMVLNIKRCLNGVSDDSFDALHHGRGIEQIGKPLLLPTRCEIDIQSQR
jgi:hypothetical protein